MKTTTRKMTLKERKQLQRSRWLLLPIYILVLVFLAIAYYFESLPVYARVAASAIPIIAAIIFTSVMFKTNEDIQLNEVTVISGILSSKQKFGSHMPMASKRSSSQPSYYIVISGTKFKVTSRMYASVSEGDKVALTIAPRSNYILGIKIL
ncbi:hypothetical protein ACFQO1_08960 [Jejudonia soesokkakensis]|uniref:Uncharacterized protein n=1 Tax=Jejudonia soesokkakensis TaxID=1323432 RepID=A0ABW2MVF8_9FLAO